MDGPINIHGGTSKGLHDRIHTGLEWLGGGAPRRVRDALLAEASAAFARSDVAALDKLLRQVHALARSVGTPLDGVHLARKPNNPAPEQLKAPAPSRWAAVSNRVPFPRRREHAPLHYPWGEEPPPRPRSSSDIVPGKPDHLLPASCRERLAAYWRSITLQYDSETPTPWRTWCQCGPDDVPAPSRPGDPE